MKFMLWRAPWLRNRVAVLVFAAWDALSLYLSYNLTYLVRLGKWEGLSLGLAVICGTWLGASYLIGRYSPQPGEEGRRNGTELIRTVVAASAVVAIFIGHSWVYQIIDAQTRFRGFLIPLLFSSCILSTIGQTLVNGARNKQKKWLLLGSLSETDTISRELKPEKGELRKRTVLANTSLGFGSNEVIRGAYTGIAVGDIPNKAGREIERLIQLREKGECVIPLLNWCEQELQRIPPELVHPEWLIQAEGFGLRPGSFSWRVKRLADIVGATILLGVTAPLVFLCCICIWLEDQGPIFYHQTRTGLYGKPIRIWKLRSMKVNAERSGAQWARKADPRITRIGNLIRATRIDELPQLVSVVFGDLSLIGPRPERPEIEEDLVNVIPNYRIRHWIRPGLSGWAQVCYPYGASIEDSRMKLSYDLYYLRNTSLLLDVLITLKTLRLVLGAEGASPKARRQEDAP